MGGGLMQIITYGPDDITLTGNPDITFFYTVYRRYTNFGKKTVSVSFDDSTNFDSTFIINVPKNIGDLISKIFLKIKLPKIDLSYLNQTLNSTNTNKNVNISAQTYLTYYDYFINFYNKLKNISNVFFNKANLKNNLTYIQDLKNYILNYFNNAEYSQFFVSIDYFFNSFDEQNSTTNLLNLNTFKNASLFKFFNGYLTYIYNDLLPSMVSYEEFKNLINQNMKILDNLNDIVYSKLIDLFSNKNDIKFCWVNKIGIYLINSIDFYIGSNKIYSLSDSYINNYSEIYYKNKLLYDKMIGNNIHINEFSSSHDSEYLYLPIPFWNQDNYGLSFPLIALQYNSLQIKINTKKFIECIRINYNENYFEYDIKNSIINSINNNSSSNNLEITLLMDIIFLDDIERKKFAQSGHEYLIEQVQQIEFNNITEYNNIYQIDAFHCCKDLFWFSQYNFNVQDVFNNDPNVFTYTYSFNPIINGLSPELINFINYVKMLSIPSILFDLNAFILGIGSIKKNLEYLQQYYFIYDYYSNTFVYPSFNNNINVIFKNSSLSLNSVTLIAENYNFFNFLQIYNYYNSMPQLGLNVYSFCLKPTEFQPSGSCNLSKISSFKLQTIVKPFENDNYFNLFNSNYKKTNSLKLIVQIRNFNVLRLIGGIGATAYTY